MNTLLSSGGWGKRAFWVGCTLAFFGLSTTFYLRYGGLSELGRALQARTVGDHTEVQEKLRGLFLGTSRTYGSGLDLSKESGELKRDHAYPYKVSKEVTNLGVPGTGPLFPAMCLQSLLGEDLRADYVILEFFHIVSGGEAKIMELAKRVRQRFPDAFLIFLMVPLPQNFVHGPSQETLTSRMGRYFDSTSLDKVFEGISTDFIDEVLVGTKDEEWNFELPVDQFNNIYEATLAVGGHLWSPIKKGISTTEQMRQIGSLFFHDASHFHVGGHDRIAWELRELLAQNRVQRSDRINPWEIQDKCSSWYQDGSISQLKHSEMNEILWAGKQKHGLEVKEEGSWFEVTNPSFQQMKVYVYHMSTSPVQEYATVQVTVSDSVTAKVACQEVVTPLVDHEIFPGSARRVHVVEGALIGTVGHGTFRINLKPLTDFGKGQQPFRVTGIALTGSEGGREVWLG